MRTVRPTRTVARGLIAILAIAMVSVVGVAFADDRGQPSGDEPDDGDATTLTEDFDSPTADGDEEPPTEPPGDMPTEPPADPIGEQPDEDPMDPEGADLGVGDADSETADGEDRAELIVTSDHALRVIETANEAAREALEQAMARYEEARSRRQAARDRRDEAGDRRDEALERRDERHAERAERHAERAERRETGPDAAVQRGPAGASVNAGPPAFVRDAGRGGPFASE